MAKAAQLDFRVDATRFNAMLRELDAIDPEVEWDDVLTSEVAAATFASQKATASATVRKIRTDAKARQWVTRNGKKYKLSHRFPDALWQQIEAQRAQALADKLAARGLARQSWLAAFAPLGVPAPGSIPNYVQRANAKGRQFTNTFITREGAGDKSGIRLTNRSPAVGWPAAKMRRALLRAINGRTSFFKYNMEAGYYRTLKSRAAKYPGIYASR